MERDPKAALAAMKLQAGCILQMSDLCGQLLQWNAHKEAVEAMGVELGKLEKIYKELVGSK